MKSEYLNSKAFNLNDEIIWDCISDKMLQSLKMLTITATIEQCRALYLCIIPIIRKFFNDFTMNDIANAIEIGGYGLYGDFTKMNPQTIHNWLKKKRLDLKDSEEKKEQREAREKSALILTSNNGGLAVILGFVYDDMGCEMPFNERLELVDKKGICPITNKPVIQIINEAIRNNSIIIGKKI